MLKILKQILFWADGLNAMSDVNGIVPRQCRHP